MSRILGCPSPGVRSYTIEAIYGNAISFWFVLPYLLGYAAVILFFPQGVLCVLLSGRLCHVSSLLRSL
jgi:hypothetical protein